MKFKIVYGKTGSGKSKYLYDDIKEKMKTNKVFVIVPEQYNLTCEKHLFEALGKKSLINVEVLTLSRMAYRLSKEVGGATDVHLSKTGKSMLIYSLLSEMKDSLNYLGKSDKNVDIIGRLFTEFKQHSVSIENLKSLDFSDINTKLKVDDAINLYSRYTEMISEKYVDEDDLLGILSKNIEKSNMFDNSYIYMDEFLGFTKQEFDVFRALLKKSLGITIAIPTDNLNTTNRETDIFYFNKVFANKLIEISHELNYDVEEVCLDTIHKYNSKELEFIEENLFFTSKKYLNEVNDIKLFLASNPYTEIENAAKNIYELVHEKGYRYKDIAIICEDSDLYAQDVKVILSKYNIPVFIDDKKDINQNILIRYVLSIFDVFKESFSYDTVFNYLKTGLIDVEYEDIYTLENYIRKWDIRGNKWYQEFSYEEVNDKQLKLEELRKKIIGPLLGFKDSFTRLKTVKDISEGLYKFLIDNNINNNLNNKLNEYNSLDISNEYNTSYKLFIEILEEMVMLFGDDVVSFEKYADLLRIGFRSADIGIIPMYQDEVTYTDTLRSRNDDVKVLFLIGLNDGIFPAQIASEGFFNDANREELKEKGIELAKDSIDNLYSTQFNYYRVFALPSDKLYLSYSIADREGKSIRMSMLLKKVKRMFINLKEESDVIETNYKITSEEASFDEALDMYKKSLDTGKELPEEWKELLLYYYTNSKKKFKKAVSGIYYSNKAEVLNKENIRKLYSNQLNTTISRLEKYRSCPFSFHMLYGLKIDEKEELRVKPVDTGSFMHEVTDKFFEKIDDLNLDVKTISDKEIEDIVEEIITSILSSSRYYSLVYSSKYRMLTKRLKKLVTESIKYIVYTLKYSDFKVMGHEVSFKPVKYELDDDRTIELYGKIDRVDIAKYGNNSYIRIIDYKSSVKDIDYNKVYAGMQIQLITYMDAMLSQNDFVEAGILYLPLVDKAINSQSNRLSEEEIKNQIKQNFKMKGIILADINVVKMMDNKLSEGESSDIIPAKLKKDGDLSESNYLLDSKQLNNLNKKVRSVIKEISNEILGGKIDAYPYYYKKQTGCDYCVYKPICMFNTSIKDNSYNMIKKYNKKNILESLREEDE